MREGIVGAKDVTHGVWKYVVLASGEARFCSTESGIQHAWMAEGEPVAHAGMLSMGPEGCVVLCAESESLGIQGKLYKAADALAQHLRRYEPPRRAPSCLGCGRQMPLVDGPFCRDCSDTPGI